MAIFFGTIVSGQTVSSAFKLDRADRTLNIGINSHAGMAWYATFQMPGAGSFNRAVLGEAAQGFASAIFSGTNGGWGIVPQPPNATMRIETATAVSATTSFCIIESAKF
jgi:hypothetical protein